MSMLNSKLSLEIISLTFSNKKLGFPYNIQEVWQKVYPYDDFPYTENIVFGLPSVHKDFDKAKEILFNNAVDYLAQKLDEKNN